MGSANTAIFEAAIDDPRLREMSTTLCVLAAVGNAADPARLAAATLATPASTRSPVAVSASSLSTTPCPRTWSATESSRPRRQPPTPTATSSPGLSDTSAGACRRLELAALAGTRFLVCSDGLTNEVADPDIAEILRSVVDPAAAARSLVERAVRPGHGRDNATVVVVDVAEGAASRPAVSGQLVLASRPAVSGQLVLASRPAVSGQLVLASRPAVSA